METYNVHEAKTQLSRLLERVRGGEEIVIAKAGEPVARLVPYAPVRALRKPGLLKGKICIGKNFDDPLPDELLAAFGAQPARK